MSFTSVMPHLYAADVDASAAFYRDQLGGRPTFRYPAEGRAEHVELQIGTVTIGLSSRAVVPREGLPAPTDGHPMELTVWCDSADDAVAALRAAGTPVLVEPHDHAAGHRRAYVADPDGNWVALVSNADGGSGGRPAARSS
jgi:lactoylglutathione lyase